MFTVSEGQLAIKSIGGEIVDSNFKPGLHFRIPLVQEVSRFDKRIITQLYRQELFLTREQEQLKVDFYVKWRINNLRRSTKPPAEPKRSPTTAWARPSRTASRPW